MTDLAAWICTRCVQLELKHPNPIPNHHRTCPKASTS